MDPEIGAPMTMGAPKGPKGFATRKGDRRLSQNGREIFDSIVEQSFTVRASRRVLAGLRRTWRDSWVVSAAGWFFGSIRNSRDLYQIWAVTAVSTVFFLSILPPGWSQAVAPLGLLFRACLWFVFLAGAAWLIRIR